MRTPSLPSSQTVIVIPAPCAFLNANDRRPHFERARLTRQWREAAGWAFRAARVRYGDQPVHVTATIHKIRAGRYDAGNFYPTAKACVDGGTDAGAWIDDDNDHLTGPDMRRGSPAPRDPRIVLAIEPIGVAS